MKTLIEIIKNWQGYNIWDSWYIDWYTMNNWFDSAILILWNIPQPQISHIRDMDFKIIWNNRDR